MLRRWDVALEKSRANGISPFLLGQFLKQAMYYSCSGEKPIWLWIGFIETIYTSIDHR